MLKNTAGQKVVVLAWDTLAQAAKTGDAANITAKISKDGGSYTALTDTNPTELERGRYAFDLTQAETNCDRWHLIPHSSTADVFVTCEEACFDTTIGATSEQSIITSLSAGDVTVASPLAASGNLTLYNNREYGGSAHSAITFTVTKDYTGATSLELSIYDPSNASTEYESLTATATSSTLISVTGSVDVTDTSFGGTGKLEARYSLFANWTTNQETIATGRAIIFQQPE